MIRLQFPWPDKALSPNAREHWSTKAAAAVAARVIAKIEALNFIDANPKEVVTAPMEVHYWFHPPDNHRRDLDNMLAMMKPYQDGIFDALGMNDADIVAMVLDRRSPRPGGVVIVSIYSAGELPY